MVESELGSGLISLAARVRDTARRERDAGPAEKANRVRAAASTRHEAVQFLAQACGTLREWPSPHRVGAEAADAALAIYKVARAEGMRMLLPFLEGSAKKNLISAVFVAEATDALCEAEQRPQVYGTIPKYPVADSARLDRLRAQVGLPTFGPTVRRASVPTPSPAPSLKQFPNGFDVLQGLLTDLPAVPSLPRVVRPTVASSEPWGCAYCCGKADPGSTELDIRGRVWRICNLCEGVEDTPQARLLDVLLAAGNVGEATARATAATARDQGWRVPLRYEDAKARPNHRPQPRWANVPVAIVAKLVAYAEQWRLDRPGVPASDQVDQSKTAGQPAQHPLPTPPEDTTLSHSTESCTSSDTIWDGQSWRSPLLRSKRAIEMLSWPPHTPLTRLQVSRALQTGEGNLDRNGLQVSTVAELRRVFADPPQWLCDFHTQREQERAANFAWQTGTAPRAATAPSHIPTPPKADPGTSTTDVPGPRDAGVPHLAPHPDMLISPKAAQALSQPPSTPLKPGRAAKLLQTAFATMQKNHLDVPTVGALATVVNSPPPWLLTFHRKLAAERRLNLVRQS
ncbi:hypothetical protein AB0469_04795 [Streptomyces sp. NPDC093801]|uniref:hypothetical protein n=1 Tax=Streptomyces sp. NPDC093801 TaxID=3155203 RepID=UPI00344EE96A